MLVVTIAGGSLFGTVGLVLAAPLTSAVTKITADLFRARQQELGAPGGEAPPAPEEEGGPPPAGGGPVPQPAH